MRIIISLLLSILLLTSCSTQLAPSLASLAYEDLTIGESHEISPQLEEISGLQYENGYFYGFNDSGGAPEVYAFSLDNPQELKTISIANAQNIDWEDMAMSASHLFIGDFGNNIGNRKDQTIYIIKKETFNLATNHQSVEAKKIHFFFPEQTNFQPQPYQHDFDMESMVYFGEELHLFTKEWKSEKTHHFTLDLVKGMQPAWLIEEFDLGFLATAADVIKLNETYSRLAIVGYNKDGEVFLMLTDFKNKSKKWLNFPKAIIKIGEADELGQVEGITFKSAKEFCISAEAIHSDLGNKEQNVRCLRIN